jgi:NYN domain/OST-HTH/LOTUS domain
VTETTERRIALFIDFENLVTNTGITAPNFNLQPALDRLLEKGKVIFRRAYCDWSRFKDAKAHLHEFGVELVDVPPSTRAGKNSADMRLVIDALELCYAREHINTFVIASGDSDFCPLAYKLRENDRFVIGLAVREATSPFFVKACDEFIYLRGQERGDAREQIRDGARAPSGGRQEKVVTVVTGDGGARKNRAVPAIAREVVSSLLSRATGPLNPSLIKEAIVRKEPDFDVRDHGFSTFSRLLEAMEKEGMLKRHQQGRQWYVVPADGSLDSKPGQDAATEDEASQHRGEDELPF